MLAYIVTLRTGRKCTVHADAVVMSERYLELHVGVVPTRTAVAVFDADEVISIISRDHLISDEPCDVDSSVVVDNAIPF